MNVQVERGKIRIRRSVHGWIKNKRKRWKTFWRKTNVISWSVVDMPNISPYVINHSLNMNPATWSLRQKKKRFALDCICVVKKVINKLLRARYINKIQYLDWLSNVVMVKKANEKWRMYVNFINLNKACLTITFQSLPLIDWSMPPSTTKSSVLWMHSKDITRSQWTPLTRRRSRSSQTKTSTFTR